MENKKNTATNNPEIVTLSREEYESQQAQLTELKLQNQWLLEQLGLAKKRQFGASSERLQEGLMDQLSLMANEAEAYAYGTKNATAEQVKVKAHARKRQSGNVLDIVPEGTPTEVVGISHSQYPGLFYPNQDLNAVQPASFQIHAILFHNPVYYHQVLQMYIDLPRLLQIFLPCC